MSKRVNIMVTEKAERQLEALTVEEDRTASEIIRRSVALYKAVRDEQSAGGKVYVERAGGVRVELIIV